MIKRESAKLSSTARLDVHSLVEEDPLLDLSDPARVTTDRRRRCCSLPLGGSLHVLARVCGCIERAEIIGARGLHRCMCSRAARPLPLAS